MGCDESDQSINRRSTLIKFKKSESFNYYSKTYKKEFNQIVIEFSEKFNYNVLWQKQY